MKLCPQCEFIYEDDQNLCDMDGEALVYDTRLGVFPGTVPAVTGATPTKSRVRIIVMAVVAGLVFPTLLCLAYYASSPLPGSTFTSRSLKAETSETRPPPQIASQDNSSSSPATNPPQSPTSPEADPESGTISAHELSDTSAQQSARRHLVAKATDDAMKTSDKSLGISRHLPPLPRLTPLPRLPPPQRLPAAKPEDKQPGSTTTLQRQVLTSQKVAMASQKALIVEVKPASRNATRRSRLGAFLKKTGRILKKPFKF